MQVGFWISGVSLLGLIAATPQLPASKGTAPTAREGVSRDAGAPRAEVLAVSEAHEVLSRPYEAASNRALQLRLTACVKEEPANAECWKLLATVYAKAKKDKPENIELAVDAWRHFLVLSPSTAADPQRYPWVDYPTLPH